MITTEHLKTLYPDGVPNVVAITMANDQIFELTELLKTQEIDANVINALTMLLAGVACLLNLGLPQEYIKALVDEIEPRPALKES